MASTEEKEVDALMRLKFPGWRQCNNYANYQPGRIIVLWNPSTVDVSILDVHSQLIHLSVTCKVTSYTFLVTFIYGFHSIATRRTLWSSLLSMASARLCPWMVLGDFNNVLFDDERINGSLVMPYETRDFLDCVISLGLIDVPSIGCRLTWSNGKVWTKLDRVMVNDAWLQLDTYVHALPSGHTSDHSPCVVTIGGQQVETRRMFKFFDMWIDHDSYHDVVQRAWSLPIYGTEQYKLCRKLKSPTKGFKPGALSTHFLQGGKGKGGTSTTSS